MGEIEGICQSRFLPSLFNSDFSPQSRRRRNQKGREKEGRTPAISNSIQCPSFGLKTPSFLDLIQMKLCQERSASLAKTLPRRQKENQKGAAPIDKLKASNFPATLLKIGTWERMENTSSSMLSRRLNFGFAFNDANFSDRVLRIEIIDDSVKSVDSDSEGCSSTDVEVKTLHICSPILAANSPFFHKGNVYKVNLHSHGKA